MGLGDDSYVQAFNSGCPIHSRRCKCSMRFANTTNARSQNSTNDVAPVRFEIVDGRAKKQATGKSSTSARIGDSHTPRRERHSILQSQFITPEGIIASQAQNDKDVIRTSTSTSTRRHDSGRSRNGRATIKYKPIIIDDNLETQSSFDSSGQLILIPTNESHKYAVKDPYSPPISTFTSVQAKRQQLWQGFLSHYLPQDLPNVSTLLVKYNKWFQLDSKTLCAALDSCMMLHHASLASDQHAVKTAQATQIKAVQLLRTTLKQPEATSQDATLCAIAALAMCCRFQRFEDTDAVHYDGLMAILRVRGPSSMQSELAREVVMHILPRSLTLAVRHRRHSLFGEPEWRAALEPYCDGPIKQIVLISCRIANMLAKKDVIVKTVSGDELAKELSSMYSEMDQIEDSLNEVITSWYGPDQQPYSVVDVKQRFPEFIAKGWPDLELFPQAYDYNHSIDAVYHNWNWVALSSVCMGKLELLGSWPSPSQTQGQKIAMVAAQGTEIVRSICRSVPYISCENSARRFRTSVLNQVMVAKFWFQASAMQREVDWCTNVMAELNKEDEDAIDVKNVASVDQVFSGWMMLLP